MSQKVFAPKASIQRVKRPAERIYGLSATPPRTLRSPSPAQIRPPPQPPKQGPTPCKNCGSTETEEGDGNIVCKACGLVLSNAPNYTSDITFEEGSNGRIQQQGQRVADGQTHQKAFAPRGLGGGPGHEATPAGEKAKTEATGVIRRFAMLLRIDEREVNMGRRIFEMAYNRGFVRGRTIESVAIVSLYIATRRAKDRKPPYDIMLIDLAEQANTNVFDLGKMMQDLIKKLYLNPDGTMSKDDHFYLQAHGAEVLIDKFVNHLDFGTDGTKIKTDATRILQRMKRDWIHHGRRPSGVCGAAVILAARMNNYRRTLREVVLVAKVTEFTVSKRLEEFKETKSSFLSVNDFRDDEVLGNIAEMDPPAYYRAFLPPKKKGKRGRPKRAPETAAEIEGSDTDSQVDGVSGDRNDTDGQPPAKRPRIDQDGFAIPALPARASQSTQPSQETQDNIDPSLQQSTPESSPAQPVRRGPGRLKGSKNWKAPPATPEELAYEAELTSSMQEALDDNPDLDPARQLPTPEASQASQSTSSSPSEQSQKDTNTPALPLRVDPSECDPRKGPPGPAVNTGAGNTGIVSMNPLIGEDEFDNDPEVSTCLLNEAERALKEKIWVTENADWLRQDHAKRIRRELKDRHLREQGIDPDEMRKGKKGHLLKRKDGARRSGRVGDVGYLKDDFHKNADDGITDAGNTDGRRPSAASMNVKAMMKQRGTYSRRINYENLAKAYEFPTRSSTSPSRSPSVDMDRGEREQSVVSVASTTSTIDSTGRDSIGPIFTGGPPKRMRSATRERLTTKTSKQTTSRDGNERSPTAEAEDNATSETDRAPEGRDRSGTAASPEPDLGVQKPVMDNRHSKSPVRDEADNTAISSSASPLSSTYTPAGVGTPGSTGPGASTNAPARIDRSMYADLGKKVGAAVAAAGKKQPNKDDEDDDEDEDEEEEEEDDDDDEEEVDPDEDLDDAFAGNFRERPVWEGEDDEVVDD